MYRTGFDPFANDPFFTDVNTELRRMNNQYQHMVGGFSGPYGHYAAIANLRQQQEQQQQQQAAEARRESGLTRASGTHAVQPYNPWMANPFSMMDAMMNSMNQSIAAAHSRFGGTTMSTMHPQGMQSFSSSSYYSYSSDGRSQPRIIEAHAAERHAPGGVRETRRAYRDSETGVSKMAVGHHLDDRAHVVERSENRRTGQREQRNEYQGFDEADADRFNDEWKSRTRTPNDRYVAHGASRASSGSAHRAVEHRPRSDKREAERD